MSSTEKALRLRKVKDHINQILMLTNDGLIQVEIDLSDDDEKVVYLDKYRKPICAVSVKGKSPLGIVKETFGEM